MLRRLFAIRQPFLGSFYPAVMATVRELAGLPSPQVHHDKKGEAITEWVSQGVPEKCTEAFRKEYLGTSWCNATLPAGYPTTNNYQEGINFSVKRIWTRHERRRLIPFLKWVNRMLHNWLNDRTTPVAGLYPKALRLKWMRLATTAHMQFAGGYWFAKA